MLLIAVIIIICLSGFIIYQIQTNSGILCDCNKTIEEIVSDAEKRIMNFEYILPAMVSNIEICLGNSSCGIWSLNRCFTPEQFKGYYFQYQMNARRVLADELGQICR